VRARARHADLDHGRHRPRSERGRAAQERLHPMLASAAMSLSSVSVIFNALRLRKLAL
jgi:hypothetical protein